MQNERLRKMPKINPFSLKNDLIFKAVFGREDPRCKRVLMDLLNSLLKLTDEQAIDTIEYKNPFNLQAIMDDKLTVMDIKVKTSAGEWIDIEMQVSNEKSYRKRSLYYWASLYKDSLQETDNYGLLPKCIVINIMVSTVITETSRYHTHFRVMEAEDHFPLTDDLDIHFIQLSRFDDTNQENLDDEEMWVMFLKDSDDTNKKDIVDNLKKKKEAIKLAYELYDEITADEEVREVIRSIELSRIDQNTREYEQYQEGIEEGKLEDAKNMLDDGLAVEKIAKYTGLSMEKINALNH